MNSEKKLKILDIILVSLIAVMLLVIMGLVIFQPPADHKLVLIVVALLALVLIALSTYRYWLAYPEQTGMKAPLFVPKAIGLGWSINPRNPIGMALTVAIVIFLVVVFGVALLK